MARILVVDDEPQIRDTLHRVLEAAGHEVREAPNGKIALSLVPETRPDLVIMDIIMPEQEGLETILALRRTAPEIKILAISGGGRFIGMETLSLALQLGADQVLAKPFTRQMVLAVTNSLLFGTIKAEPTDKPE